MKFILTEVFNNSLSDDEITLDNTNSNNEMGSTTYITVMKGLSTMSTTTFKQGGSASSVTLGLLWEMQLVHNYKQLVLGNVHNNNQIP